MTKPKTKIYTSSETEEQKAVIEYCDLLHIPIVHIPNEGKRSISNGALLKSIGLRKGFPDLFIPRARGHYNGLFIEMKYGAGKASTDQIKWLNILAAEGYACFICYSAAEAIKVIEYYQKLKNTKEV